ncbi:MAG: YfiM family protein [Bacteroidales bacterium]|nr:YfiM family protein [Bacteroidales bacterium]
MFLSALICNYFPAHCQGYDTIQNNYKKATFWGIYSTAYITTMTSLYFAWYKNYKSTSFHWFDDANEWKQMDKCGHTFTAYQLNQLTYNSLKNIGYSKKQSLFYSTSISWFLMNSIEIFDGFSEKWGASYTDIIGNTIGTLLFSLQESSINKQIASIKFSYHFTPLALHRPEALGFNLPERILKDYNGQTYWLSININDIFPKFKPSWLNFSFGYSAYNMIYAQQADATLLQSQLSSLTYDKMPYRRYFFSLDVQPRKIKVKQKWLRKALLVFNTIKFPFPSIEINKHRITLHGLYF